MKYMNSIIITTSIKTIMPIIGVRAETDQTNSKQHVASQQAEDQPIFSDEVDPHFHKAVEYFSKKETAKAAEEIRKGALFLKKQSRGELGETRRCLLNAGQNLEQLADRIEKGKATCEKDLRATFARVHRDLRRNLLDGNPCSPAGWNNDRKTWACWIGCEFILKREYSETRGRAGGNHSKGCRKNRRRVDGCESLSFK